MKKIALVFALITFIGANLLYAQTTVTGTVTGADDGSPIPGASVRVKNVSGVGTVTDYEGNYSLEVPDEGEVLVFSFTGMTSKEVPIDGRTTINVALESEEIGLDEVVVTAIGMKRQKKKLGYSVSDVDAETIEKSNSTNVVNSLRGKVAGVNINSSSGSAGASTFIEIRGSSSITRSNQPLFVVDGMPIDNGQAAAGTDSPVEGVTESNRAIDLNPDDIASISVLKGGAATALYGLRAANGAIIIETKSGQRSEEGYMNVDVKSSVTISQVSQLPELQDQYVQGNSYYQEQMIPTWYGLDPQSPITHPDQAFYAALSWGPHKDDVVYTKDPDFVPANHWAFGGATPMNEWIDKWDPNGRMIRKSDAENFGYKTAGPVQTYNPYDIFQTGVSWNNHVSVTAGDANSSHYFSVGRQDNESFIPNDTFDKTTIKFNSSRDLTDKITVGANASYVNSGGNRIQKGSNISGLMLGLVRTPPTFDNSYGYEFDDGSQRSFRGGGGYDNPYWIVNNIKYMDNIDRIIGNVNISWDATDWLSFTYRAGTDYYGKNVDYYFSKNSNAYPGGRKDKWTATNKEFNSDLIMNISQQFGEDISFDFTAGHNMYQSEYTESYTEANDLVIPDFYTIGNTTDNRGSEDNFMKRTAAYYGDVTLGFRDMLYLGLTGRYEWSTTMPADNNAFFYPSANLGFIFTELPFMQNNNLLSFGKLRASYARVANDGPAYSTRTYYVGAGSADGWTNGVEFPFMGASGFTYSGTIGNNSITPELQTTIEVGADLRFFNNRLSVDFAYFQNNNEDLLLYVPIASSTGFFQAYLNAASMETKGIELLVNATPVRTNDFSWDISFNFSNPQSEVTKLAEGVPNVFLGGFVSSQVRAVAGEAYRSVYSTGWVETEDGQVVINDDPSDVHMDGFPMQDETMKSVGEVAPQYTMGISNSLSFKGFSASALLEIKQGGLMWNGTKGALYFFGTHADTESRGEKKVWEGVNGHYDDEGNLVTGGENDTEVTMDENWYWGEGYGSGFTGPSEPFIEETSWIRLREVTFAYNFSNLLAETAFRNAEFFFTGTNLFLETPYTGVDPESNLYGASNAQGMDYFNNPGVKSYTFGLRLGF